MLLYPIVIQPNLSQTGKPRVYMAVSLLTKIKQFLKGAPQSGPIVVPRAKHSISRGNINPNALKVLYRLKQQGFQAYLVGGGVRDLLLGLHPKDFDVATNATPDEIKEIFHNCRLIGRRFRLAHVVFGRDCIEVATFRKQAKSSDDPNHAQSDEGMLMRDNVYGSLEEDAWRRDFTINALYYNIHDFSVVDFTGGLKDLQRRQIRMIGDPKTRYREDPVRMLRAIRFAAKLSLKLDKSLVEPIPECKHLIKNIPSARLYDEILKLLHSGAGTAVWDYLVQYDLLECVLGDIASPLHQPEAKAFLMAVLESTDVRVKAAKPIQPAFVLAALIWHALMQQAQDDHGSGMPFFVAQMKAIEHHLQLLLRQFSIPKRIVHACREICQFQLRLARRDGKRAFAMLTEPRFRAAYDFLVIRAQMGEDVGELSDWWTTFIDAPNHQQKTMVQELNKSSQRTKRRRRKSAQ